MTARIFTALLFIAALAGCKPSGADFSDVPVRPAMWEISDQAGVHGHLFGTIHSLPDGVEWRTGAEQEALDKADSLVLEVAEIDDDAAIARLFERLAKTPGQPPLADRVGPEQQAALADLMETAGMEKGSFTNIETWAAALMLARAVRQGKRENGVDRALLAMGGDKTVIELEGAARQLALFDSLPEREQRDLLSAIVAEADSARTSELNLARHWLSGDTEAIEAETKRGMMADPELREALLVARNRAWAEVIGRMLDSGRKPFVAVGAAHLVGPEGLVALLERRGYTVVRTR